MKRNDTLLSIIVPIYNGEKHLHVLFESLKTKTNHNIEIILIDDGSTDDTEIICRKYIAYNKNAIYYKKNNTGVSDTRNVGILKATGKYIAFADSDDYYEINALDSLCSILESTPEHDIYLFKANRVFDTKKTPIDFPIQQGSWDGDIFRNTYYLSFALGRKTNGKNLSLPIWCSVFSKSFLLKFGSSFDTYLRKAEDFIFTAQVLSNASKIFVIHETYYNGSQFLTNTSNVPV